MIQAKALISFLAAHHNQPIHLIGPLCQRLPELTDTHIPFIFVDGGSVLRENCPHPSISIGDGDSSPLDLDILLPADKDISDLGAVLANLDGFCKVYLHGFIGARRDHEYFNLGEVYRFACRQKRCYVQFDQHLSILSAGHWQCEINGTFSIGSLIENQITMSGQCRYPLTHGQHLLPLSSLGLSNQGFGRIDIQCNKPLMLFYQDATFSMITPE